MNNAQDDLPDIVGKCIDILDENIEILTNLKRESHDEKYDHLTPKMELHNLYDMAEDVAVSSKLKNAESSLMRRYFERNDDDYSSPSL